MPFPRYLHLYATLGGRRPRKKPYACICYWHSRVEHAEKSRHTNRIYVKAHMHTCTQTHPRQPFGSPGFQRVLMKEFVVPSSNFQSWAAHTPHMPHMQLHSDWGFDLDAFTGHPRAESDQPHHITMISHRACCQSGSVFLCVSLCFFVFAARTQSYQCRHWGTARAEGQSSSCGLPWCR